MLATERQTKSFLWLLFHILESFSIFFSCKFAKVDTAVWPLQKLNFLSTGNTLYIVVLLVTVRFSQTTLERGPGGGHKAKGV
jgi:hypothetical protein